MESNGTSIFVVIFLAVLIPLRSADRVDVRLPGPVGAGGRAAADDRGQGQHLGLHRRGGRRPDRGDPDGGTAAQRGAGLPLYPAGNGGGGVCGLLGWFKHKYGG